ncbi:NADPH-dependent glutamate synthase beta subunit-like oxidoreductase [Elusimicrobium posterum]
MDAARCALRLGPESVSIVYRRGREEMPAREEEIENAVEEGVKLEILTIQKEIIADENGKVTGLKCLKAKLGEPDASGRRRPEAIEGSDFVMDVDTVIVAIGQKPNPIIPKTTKGLEIDKRGVVVAGEGGATSLEGVYAGGDIIRGGATVLLAMRDGIQAAEKINKYLEGK